MSYRSRLSCHMTSLFTFFCPSSPVHSSFCCCCFFCSHGAGWLEVEVTPIYPDLDLDLDLSLGSRVFVQEHNPGIKVFLSTLDVLPTIVRLGGICFTTKSCGFRSTMSNLGILPVALVALCFLTFITSYIVGVARGDVPALFPYISDTGSKRPESCIFGLFLNIAVFILIAFSSSAFCTMYIRYKAVQALSVTVLDDHWLRRMNKGSMFAGIISCVGCLVVANFQEGTEVEDVHLIGAGVTFILGIFYCFLQTALSYHMYPDFNGRRICKVRLAISMVSIFSAMLTVASAAYAVHQWNESSHNPGETKIKWSSGDVGYAAHIVSTFGEWLTSLSFFCFFLTYVGEFNKFELDVKIRPLVFHLNDNLDSLEEADERTRLLM